MFGEENAICTGLTSAAKAEQNSTYCTGITSPTNQPQSRQSDRLFLQSSELDPPTPSPTGDRAPPPFGSEGGQTRLLEMGWGVPIRTRGQTPWNQPRKDPFYMYITLRVPICLSCDSHQGPPLPYFSGYIPKANWTKS
jgi:hypothetical protein